MTAAPGGGTSAPVGGPAATDRRRVVFFGSGAFAVPILDALATDPRVAVVGAVTTPDRPAGRHGELRRTPVAERAAQLGIETLKPARLRTADAIEAIERLRPDLGVVADYGRIVPPAILELPPHGILNVHPSLLPRHRGAAPIQATILAGDDEAGVSIMAMDEGLDTGPIVARHGWPLSGTERGPELEARAADEGARLLARTIGPWLDGTAVATPQDEAAATMTRPLRREDGQLDPALPAADLERQVRALVPWPGAFIETEAGRLVVHEVSLAPVQPLDEPPTIVEQDGRPAIATANGRLVLERVQAAGGRPLGGAEYLRGHREILGGRVLKSAADRTP